MLEGLPTTISRTHPRHITLGKNPGPEKGYAKGDRQPKIRIREAD